MAVEVSAVQNERISSKISKKQIEDGKLRFTLNIDPCYTASSETGTCFVHVYQLDSESFD